MAIHREVLIVECQEILIILHQIQEETSLFIAASIVILNVLIRHSKTLQVVVIHRLIQIETAPAAAAAAGEVLAAVVLPVAVAAEVGASEGAANKS